MDELLIFIFGCTVFVVAFTSGFLYLIASDDPNNRD